MMAIFRIRTYRSTDLDQVVDLFSRAVREVNRRDYSAEQLAVWAPEPPDKAMWAERLASGGVFVCEGERGLTGFARILRVADGDGYLDLLFVHPEALGQGVGRVLMERVLAWAAEQRLKRITSDVSITARPFMEKQGFTVVAAQTVSRGKVEFRNFKMALAL
jgi:putative acetyltransferase